MTFIERDASPGMCALLLKTMYGTQDTSRVWHKRYIKKLMEGGFVQCKAWTSVFSHPEKNAICCMEMIFWFWEAKTGRIT